MASTIWKGYLTFGMISVPVRLYAAARSETISFHMLHEKCGSRIKQQLWCPVDEEIVQRKDIVKGYEIDEGTYVTVDEKDLEKIQPESARTIDVLEFVPAKELDAMYLDTSYFLVPDEAGTKAYYLLQSVLEEMDVEGVARLVMHQREHIVAVRPSQGGLMLHTLFFEDEVRKVDDFGKRGHIRVTEKELEMGKTFVKALITKFDPSKYKDEYRAAVEKMLEEKAAGKEITAAPEVKTAPIMDLMAALKASLDQTGDKSPAKARAAIEKAREQPAHKSREDFKKRSPARKSSSKATKK